MQTTSANLLQFCLNKYCPFYIDLDTIFFAKLSKLAIVSYTNAGQRLDTRFSVKNPLFLQGVYLHHQACSLMARPTSCTNTTFVCQPRGSNSGHPIVTGQRGSVGDGSRFISEHYGPFVAGNDYAQPCIKMEINRLLLRVFNYFFYHNGLFVKYVHLNYPRFSAGLFVIL